MDASSNKLGGTFPALLGTMSTLGYLDLANNGYEGTLPTALFTLTLLTSVLIGNV